MFVIILVGLYINFFFFFIFIKLYGYLLLRILYNFERELKIGKKMPKNDFNYLIK